MAIVKITEKTYVHSCIFTFIEGCDVMAVLYQPTPEEPRQATIRFRHYDPESKDPWDGKDEKNAYTVKFTSEKEKDWVVAEQEILRCLVVTGKPCGLKDENVHVVVVQGGPEAFSAALKNLPFIHTREGTAADDAET